EGQDVFVSNLALDPGGRCLVSGMFDSVNGEPRLGLVRLLSNGGLDDTFRPPSSLDFSTCCASRIAIQPDGRVLILTFHQGIWLNEDGSVDSIFQLAPEILGADNRMVVTTNNQPILSINQSINQPIISNPSTLVRLQPNGSPDPAFHRAQFVTYLGVGQAGW